MTLTNYSPHRWEGSPAATSALTTAFLRDLIADGHLPPEMSYLASDPSKLVRARKVAMGDAKDKDMKNQKKIVGLGYDGRRDHHTRAMVKDSSGKTKMRMITEEHESVTEEPSGKYLAHFVPEAPVGREKPALKVAHGLLSILEKNSSTNSLMFLAGDSTNMNTGWKGGTHALLEKILGRRLYWGICILHTNELPLRHPIILLDGPTCSDKGFTDNVCSLLSKVNEMPYDPDFRALPGGEELIILTEDVLTKMSTDQCICYKLVKAVKEGDYQRRCRRCCVVLSATPGG